MQDGAEPGHAKLPHLAVNARERPKMATSAKDGNLRLVSDYEVLP
jgi:hypothetical protein